MVFIAELFWWFENVKPDFVQPRDVHELKDGEWQASERRPLALRGQVQSPKAAPPAARCTARGSSRGPRAGTARVPGGGRPCPTAPGPGAGGVAGEEVPGGPGAAPWQEVLSLMPASPRGSDFCPCNKEEQSRFYHRVK